LCLDNELRRYEAKIEQEYGEKQERCSVEAELTAALDHLGYAELWPLRGMQRDEERPDASRTRLRRSAGSTLLAAVARKHRAFLCRSACYG
jgi:hypothetical protein